MSSLPALNWLLEPANPAVRLRTMLDVQHLDPADPDVQLARASVLAWLPQAGDLAWLDDRGLLLTYNLTALAECGLTREDLPIAPLVDRLLEARYDAACGDYMLLRALVMLGYARDPRVAERLGRMRHVQLPDGAWLCLHRLRNRDEVPKSCIKAAMHALLLAGELAKRGIVEAWSGDLVHYFIRRRLFYRSDKPGMLVLPYRPGWRMTDVFMPAEVQRVGLPQLLEALTAAGAGAAPQLVEAWQLLASKKDDQQRVVLEGTQNKPYLPHEPVGKPSKWATLYTVLAEQALLNPVQEKNVPAPQIPATAAPA
ncbi:MAG: hypothetical protein ACYC6L_02770 [Anaerolineae bacterium]